MINLKAPQKNPALVLFFVSRKKVNKNCQKLPKNGCYCKKGMFYVFFLILSELVLQKELRFCLHCMKCIKMLLLSHKNQIFVKFYNFYLLRLWRRWLVDMEYHRVSQGLIALGGASYEGSLDKPWMLSRSKNIKMSLWYVPKTP